MATRSLGSAPLWRRELNVVTPAHQRRGLGRVERLRHPRQRFHRRDHVFLIPAVVADAANLPVRAVHEIPASARKTGTVLPAVPADSNPLAFLPFLHARAQLVDHAGHFVSWDARVRNAREKAFLGDHIAVTDSTGLDADSHVSRAGLGNFALHDFEIRSRLRYLHRFHFRHWLPPVATDLFVAHSPCVRYFQGCKAGLSVSLPRFVLELFRRAVA